MSLVSWGGAALCGLLVLRARGSGHPRFPTLLPVLPGPSPARSSGSCAPLPRSPPSGITSFGGSLHYPWRCKSGWLQGGLLRAIVWHFRLGRGPGLQSCPGSGLFRRLPGGECTMQPVSRSVSQHTRAGDPEITVTQLGDKAVMEDPRARSLGTVQNSSGASSHTHAHRRSTPTETTMAVVALIVVKYK